MSAWSSRRVSDCKRKSGINHWKRLVGMFHNAWLHVSSHSSGNNRRIVWEQKFKFSHEKRFCGWKKTEKKRYFGSIRAYVVFISNRHSLRMVFAKDDEDNGKSLETTSRETDGKTKRCGSDTFGREFCALRCCPIGGDVNHSSKAFRAVVQWTRALMTLIE